MPITKRWLVWGAFLFSLGLFFHLFVWSSFQGQTLSENANPIVFNRTFPDPVTQNDTDPTSERGNDCANLTEPPHLLGGQLRTTDSPVQTQKSVLVTSAAGFIGFQLALELHSKGDIVIGLDSFVSAQRSNVHRANQLRAQGIPIVNGDTCDSNRVRDLILTFKVTHVAHMATDAEFRSAGQFNASTDNCFSNLLDVVREINAERADSRRRSDNGVAQNASDIVVVWASSASVYALERQCSPCPMDPLESTIASLKRADEAIAFSFHERHGIRLTGLRFFTVFGPWEDPHSNVYSLAEKLLRDETISPPTGANCSENGGQSVAPRISSQDFTFIEDALKGIVSSLDLGAQFEIFNIGSGQTHQLTDIVGELELHLGLVLKFKNLSSQTPPIYSNIGRARAMLGYEPIVPLSTGIRNFVDWYLDTEYPRDFIMTTYFSIRTDPQQIIKGNYKSNFTMMEQWYRSAQRHNLTAFIFHDELSDQFVDTYETRQIRFIKVKWPNSSLSNNDQRFFFWRDHLQSRLQATNGNSRLEPRYVLTTDLFDVRFGQNPFHYMSETKAELYLSTETTQFGNNPWMKVKMKNCGYDWTRFEKKSLINAGVMGGKVRPYLDMLNRVIEELQVAPRNSTLNCNMAAVNYVVHSQIGDHFVTGQPFHSKFKEFTTGDDLYVYHKR